MTPTRRLAAIMAADVAGFSAAMERDEEGTFARVQELRTKIIEPKIAEHTGRLVKTTGDGFLAEFGSPIAAMRCALAIQAELAGNALQLRIGLNLGDVIVEASGDVYGEGVNVAARLEALADPGGILISAKVHSEVEGKVEAAFEDRGEQQVKNIARPVRVYAVGGPGARASGATASAVAGDMKPLPLPDKPSIAVLPFQNMSGDPEQEYFADGMVEDIITALSRFNGLFVIARNSSFTYKSKAVDIKQVGRELGVRYVLEGSVRKAGGRVRITGQLIEAATGVHLWADRFEGPLDDVFELQDRVSSQVVGVVAPKIERAEIERAVTKSTENLEAHDWFLRGMAKFYEWSRDANDVAMQMFGKALELDPKYGAAMAGVCGCYVNRGLRGWTVDRSQEAAEAIGLARRCQELGRDDAFILSMAGWAIMFFGEDLDTGGSLASRILFLNPNYVPGWHLSGWANLFSGNYRSAIEEYSRAMQLDPFHPVFNTLAMNNIALAHVFLGEFREGQMWAQKALADDPTSPGGLRQSALADVALGQLERAQQTIGRLLELSPSTKISTTLFFRLTRKLEDRAKYAEYMRLAGMPE